jgi:hypothetical protein
LRQASLIRRRTRLSSPTPVRSFELFPILEPLGAFSARSKIPSQTITGPDDLNFGIKTFLNGALVSNIVLDTSAAATDTIDYVVTDQDGLSATRPRTVIIQAANDNQASSTPSNDNEAASTTNATSTAAQ